MITLLKTDVFEEDVMDLKPLFSFDIRKVSVVAQLLFFFYLLLLRNSDLRWRKLDFEPKTPLHSGKDLSWGVCVRACAPER